MRTKKMAASTNNVNSDLADMASDEYNNKSPSKDKTLLGNELNIFRIGESHTVTITLFENVKNARELRKMLMDGKFECSFIDPSMVVDVFQVLVAIHKAVKSKENAKMTTKTVFTEIVNNLSCKRSISHALKTFGLKDTDSSLLTVILNDATGDKLKDLMAQIDGSVASLKRISKLTDVLSVKKEYGVTPTELKVGTLLDAVVERMATKDFVSY